ncbi:sce7726 family protein [Algoriphagus formosus]|uniref:Sce7726 family protein n=1 Tax=Algoriphagus formosus TaxID=2007308 RepID=A0A4R5V9A5_9BACT|nr:sce7726 family protein [Algoriphagus aquimaris]TDK48235.1 hypothetical protein E1898_04255 [Algoriphagus aquimaris]
MTFSDPKQLAALYSNASFRSLCRPDRDLGSLIDGLSKIDCSQKKGHTVRSLLKIGYDQLLQNYRHEYVFKTALFKDFILSNYALENSILLNEFKIGRSIADTVLVNGTNKVFEIKTELDSPFRLDSQIGDYKKVFSEVYLVVHYSQAEKYAKIISSEIGLLCFSEFQGFSRYKEAKVDNSQLEITTMAKTLRKEELILLATVLNGDTPIATPVKLFNTCLDIIKNFSAEQVQKEYLKIIKRRIRPNVNEKVLSNQIPSFLKFFCYTENIKEKDYIHLLNSLELTF